MTSAAIWQEVEFGSYGADLPLWVELAAEADGKVAELGAGAGRVSLHLAGHGHEVIAVERDLDLIRELERLAEQRGVSVSVVAEDLGSPAEVRLPVPPALAIGPLHLIQIIDPPSRPALLARLRDVIAPGGTLALTLVDESTLLTSGAASTQILPDMRELDGWVYSSEPLWVQVGDQELTIRRLRETVSPGGRMERDIHDETLHRIAPDALESEAVNAGLQPSGRRQISSGENEADSTVVLLEVPG
jgi:predicted O-methyltransferase YrrM